MPIVAALPWIMMAVSAASAIYSGVQQGKVADANAEAQEKNNEALRVAAIQQYDDLSPAERDINEQSLEEGLAQKKQLIKERSRINLLAGASGTYGGSVDSMLSDLTRNYGQNISTIIRNRDTRLSEVAVQAEQIRYGARAQMTNRVFNKPSGVAIALDTAAAAGQGYQAGAGFAKTYNEASSAKTIKGG